MHLEEAAESGESDPEAGEKETPEEEPMIPQKIVDDLTLDGFTLNINQSFGSPKTSPFFEPH